jgi:hypothetical protein
MGMLKNRKIGKSLETGELLKNKLRMLKSGQAFQVSPVNTGRVDQESTCEGSLQDIRNALLDAEYMKAKALVAFQNNRRFY